MAGAPLGNTNAAKARPWTAAIHRALAKRTLRAQRDELDSIAEKLLDMCAAGDLSSIQELGNRLDGKPHQTVDANLDAGSALLAALAGLGKSDPPKVA